MRVNLTKNGPARLPTPSWEGKGRRRGIEKEKDGALCAKRGKRWWEVLGKEGEEGGVENLNVRTKETFHQMIEANSKSCRANNKSLYFITDFIRINIGGHHLFQPLIKQNNNDSGWIDEPK